MGAVIGTILTGEEGVGRGGIAFLIDARGLVHLGTAREGDALGDIEGQTSTEDKAVLVVFGDVAVDFPVGVHHRKSLVAEGPVLGLEVAFGVVLLKGSVLADIVAGGEEVDGDDGVEVETLGYHVLFLHTHVHGAEVKVQTVFEEVSGVADGEVVERHLVVLHDALGIGGRGRDKSLAVLRTYREGNRVAHVVTCLEEVERVVA